MRKAEICPHCGYSEAQQRSPLVLPHRSLLSSRYLVGRVLGEPGGFGVTYLAFDQRLEIRVAIKEYVPRELAGRGSDGESVVPYSGTDEGQFEYGLDRFLGEAKALAQFEHAHIVSVRDFFEANGTAYLVMDYYEGKTLQRYLDEQPEGWMDTTAATEVMLRVLDGLREVHAADYLHRDVKPENVYLTAEGRPILIDFGAARQALGERSRSLSVVMTPGYAPYEQYRRDGDQGPWTDVYGCGATLYRMVTGQKPPPATDRIVDDTLEPPHQLNPQVPERISRAIVESLATGNKKRPSTAAALQKKMRRRREEPQNDGNPGGKGGKSNRGTRPSHRKSAPDRSTGEEADTSRSVPSKKVGSLRRTFEKIGEGVCSVSFSPRKSFMAVGGVDGSVAIWDFETDEVWVRRIPGKNVEVDFSPDERLVAAGGGKATTLLSVEGADVVRTLSECYLAGMVRAGVTSVAFSPDGEFVASGSNFNTAKLWSIKTGKEKQVLSPLSILDAFQGNVTSVDFSPAGDLVAIGELNGTAKLSTVQSGKVVQMIHHRDGGSVESVAFSPDGTLLVTGGSDTEARLWEVYGGKYIQTLSGHEELISSVAFSPDKSVVATGSWANTAKLWSVDNGRELANLNAHDSDLLSVAFSPDGSLLATGSRDGRVKLWDVSSIL